MGKIKRGVNIICKSCKKEFYVPLYRSKSASFCSLLCQNHKQYSRYKFICKGCGKYCETSPSRKNYKKQFCSLSCRESKAIDDKARRKNQKAISIISRGHLKSRTLRKYISEFKEMKCEICGYKEYDFCLDMHHVDHNPKNNDPDNIGILCCICHRKVHKGVISYAQARKKKKKKSKK
jgi:hypothetical protein